MEKTFKLLELNKKAYFFATCKINADYQNCITRLQYAKNFTPHKVAYYEELLTIIVTRADDMYQFDIEGNLLNPVMPNTQGIRE